MDRGGEGQQGLAAVTARGLLENGGAAAPRLLRAQHSSEEQDEDEDEDGEEGTWGRVCPCRVCPCPVPLSDVPAVPSALPAQGSQLSVAPLRTKAISVQTREAS